MSLWAPSRVDQLAADHINYRTKSQPSTKTERLVKCLTFAAEHGNEFWSVISKAVEQVINDFKLVNGAESFLRKLLKEQDKRLAEYLMPFMLYNIKETQTELDILVGKGLIYDLLVKISQCEGKSAKINLEPLIVSLGCSEAANEEEENEIEEKEEEIKSEEIEEPEVSYSTHLKDREIIKQKLKVYAERHTEPETFTVEDAFATPKWTKTKSMELPATPAIKSLEEYDSPYLTKSNPITTKAETPEPESLSPCVPLQSSSFNHAAEKSNDLRTSALSAQLFNDSNEQQEKPENYTGFNFSSMSELEASVDSMRIEETETVEKNVSISSETRTSSSISEPVFDWASICIDRIGHFKDSMALRCVAFHPTQDELIFGSNGSSLRLCTNLNDLARDPIQPVFTLDQIHEASVYCCAYSSDGEYVATGSNDKMVKLLRRETTLESDEPILKVIGEMSRHEATVRKVAFVPNSAKLISGGGGEGKCYITQCETEEVIATLTPEESKSTNLVTDLVVPSETIVYTVLNGNVYQWDIRSMNKSSINIGANIQSISSSSGVGANFIATGAENGRIALWDIRHSTLPVYQYDNHVKAVRSVSLVDEWLGAVSMDGLISLHHMQKTDGPLVELSQAEKVINIQIDPGLKRLATTSSDGWFSYYSINT